MLIAIAGPYSADSEEQRKKNLDIMNEAAVKVYEMGHIPVIGVNAALFVIENLNSKDKYKAMMDISLAIVGRCDALYFIAESPGANKERDLILSLGKKIYYSLDEIPKIN